MAVGFEARGRYSHGQIKNLGKLKKVKKLLI
jgi:hypothetical protein